MKRGDIWTVAGGGDYVGKPRPCVILQSDRYSSLESVTICALTTNPSGPAEYRVTIQPNPRNGLDEPSRVMVDKLGSVKKSRFGRRIGSLDPEDLTRTEYALLDFLEIVPPAS